MRQGGSSELELQNMIRNGIATDDSTIAAYLPTSRLAETAPLISTRCLLGSTPTDRAPHRDYGKHTVT